MSDDQQDALRYLCSVRKACAQGHGQRCLEKEEILKSLKSKTSIFHHHDKKDGALKHCQGYKFQKIVVFEKIPTFATVLNYEP